MIAELGKATLETRGFMLGVGRDSVTKPRPIAKWDPA